MNESENTYYSYIKKNISIKDVCDRLGIVTQKTGDDYICCCIFHNDTNPSMHIRSGKNNFYCYGCGKSGLSAGNHANFEKYVPAVRYQKGRGIYLTGYGLWDSIKENVSFAYQIDMSVIHGGVEIRNGMFRPFYDCWKSYIDYIQEGIEKLKGEKVYRIKLDIQGFYDNIRQFVIRDALYEPVLQALRSDEDKFKYFCEENAPNFKRAENLINWLIEELFKEDYYDSETGACMKKEPCDRGIPQGPAISSYAANVALFSMDKKVWEGLSASIRIVVKTRLTPVMQGM